MSQVDTGIRRGSGSGSPAPAPVQPRSAWQNTFQGAALAVPAFQPSPPLRSHSSSVSPPLQASGAQLSPPFIAGRGSASPPFGFNVQGHIQPMYTDFMAGNSTDGAAQYAGAYSPNFGDAWSKAAMSPGSNFMHQPASSRWQGGSNQGSLSINTNTGPVPNGALSATTLAFLAAANGQASLDPTMAIYDENTGGYATPSYAGSVADDSSFDDRDHNSHSPFSRPVSSHNNYEGRHDLGQPFLSAGQDLYAFRDAHHRAPSDWDSASSVSGAADDPPSRASPAAAQPSPDMGSRTYVSEGNGLEMAVGRMFAPIASPKPFPPSPIRDDTLKAAPSPPVPEGEPVNRVFTASPSHSPRLAAQETTSMPTVPTFSRLSPSPSSPAFRTTTASPPDGQPSLRSPPLPNGLGRPADQNRLSTLAPLAIPAAPDLTLTTATPTAVPRTATMRQDSTQAALDTVFSTFFDKANAPARTDSLDSRPDTTLPPDASQALFDIPVHNMTLRFGSGDEQRRLPIRQRSKSDTYMTSPIGYTSPSGFSFRVDQPAGPAGQQGQSVDPKQLGAESPLPALPSPAPLGLDAARQNVVPAGPGSGEDRLSATRESQVGPSARRRSLVGASSPYDPAFSVNNIGPGNQISPTGQIFLVPPNSATRRSRSAGGHRVVQSEDLTSTSNFTPRTAQFLLDTPTALQVPNLPSMPAPDAGNNANQQGFQGNLSTGGLQQGPSAFFDNFASMPQMPASQNNMFQQYDTHNFAALNQPSYPAYNIPVDRNGNIVPPDAMAFNNFSNLGWPQMPALGQNNASTSGNGGGQPGNIVFSALDDDSNSSQLDPRSLAVRGRRRSSVRSDTSGYSGISGAGSEGLTLESKTTEATKQAARRRRKDPNNAKFSCDYCGETFTRAYNLKGHIRSHEGSKPFVCATCGKGFARRHDLKRHELLHTGEKKYICEACKTPFVRLDALQRHHKSENGAACVAHIKDMAERQGVDMSTFAGVDMSEFTRGVEL